MFWYQINPYYFYQIVNKKNLPGANKEISFYNLVKENIQRIIDMKCDGIWIMPLYIRGEANRKGNGSPYAVKEFKFDHQFGEEQELIELVNECHKNGLKVITEYIPNHMAHDAPFIKENPDVIYTDTYGNPLFDQNWSDTVKLKHKNPKVQKFTCENMKRILGDYGFDGFRIDMAHCPFYDIDGKPYQGEWDSHFWRNVLDDDFFKKKQYILIAEVYDDRNKDYAGYGDHIKLMENNMIVYDKKIHDILAHKLKNYEIYEPIQELFYRELSYQYEAMKVAKLIENVNAPFLRIPTNHDDNPGIWNFGGIEQYKLAFTLHSLLTGHSMIYNGDEFGLAAKLSTTLEDIYDEKNNISETKNVILIDDSNQERNFENVLRILHIRSNLITIKHKLLIAKLLTREHILSNDLIAFIYFAPNSHEITIIAANLSNDSEEKWGQISEFYPSFDEEYNQYNWNDILEKCGINLNYTINDIFNNESFGVRNTDDEFWIGLKGLKYQILKIKGV